MMCLTFLWVLSLVSKVLTKSQMVSMRITKWTLVILLSLVGVPLLQTSRKCCAHRQTPWTLWTRALLYMIQVSTRTAPLFLEIIILPVFAIIVSDLMWLLQDKSPVVDQTTQPELWTKQVLQQSITNRHVVCDTGRPVGIFSTVSFPPSRLSFFSYYIFMTIEDKSSEVHNFLKTLTQGYELKFSKGSSSMRTRTNRLRTPIRVVHKILEVAYLGRNRPELRCKHSLQKSLLPPYQKDGYTLPAELLPSWPGLV